ncbi:hypothetical protein [Secundilactobacillus oryzae]|nr:hypothetical protein [Secundilactobacillus oryzae]
MKSALNNFLRQRKMRELLLYSGLQAVAWWFFVGHFTGKIPPSHLMQ